MMIKKKLLAIGGPFLLAGAALFGTAAPAFADDGAAVAVGVAAGAAVAVGDDGSAAAAGAAAVAAAATSDDDD